jgi:hypothetical protein
VVDERKSRLEDEYDIAGIINEIFIKVCRMVLARNGVSHTGIFPLNRNVFNDTDWCLSSDIHLLTCRGQNCLFRRWDHSVNKQMSLTKLPKKLSQLPEGS